MSITRFTACAFLLSSLLVGSASAETVMKFDLAGSPAPDVAYTSSVLATVPDGNGAVTGDKTTNLNFLGFLDFIPNIPSGASLSLSGVDADGSATVMGSLVTQDTTGGSVEIWDDSNVLLLSGDFAAGVIVGTDTNSTGAFVSTTPVVYTGGTLLPLVDPGSGAFSLSLTNITSASGSGMDVAGGVLQNFTASAVGQLEATAVPEPSVLGMAALGALVVLRKHRRRRAKKTA